MAFIAAAIGAISVAVQMSSQYSQGHGTATQHARVILERIERMVCEASANADFPGFAVFSEVREAWTFSDTLVVWHPPKTETNPKGLPQNPDGLPLFEELIIFCPDPLDPNVLLEIRPVNDSNTVPALSETASWASALAAIKSSSDVNRVTLTELLHTAEPPSGGKDGQSERGALRFNQRLRPSEEDMKKYQASSVEWKVLPWVQGIYGSKTGLRQSWLQFELQLTSTPTGGINQASDLEVIPFFGSAALYYEMKQ